MPTSGNNTAQVSDSEYIRNWTAMMTKIWRDRLAKYDVYHTGALLRSVTPGNVNVHDMQGSISFRFLQYGVYVDAGTGKGYTRGNDGNLEFLGAAYRRQRGLGKPRNASRGSLYRGESAWKSSRRSSRVGLAPASL